MTQLIEKNTAADLVSVLNCDTYCMKKNNGNTFFYRISVLKFYSIDVDCGGSGKIVFENFAISVTEHKTAVYILYALSAWRVLISFVVLARTQTS